MLQQGLRRSPEVPLLPGSPTEGLMGRHNHMVATHSLHQAPTLPGEAGPALEACFPIKATRDTLPLPD